MIFHLIFVWIFLIIHTKHVLLARRRASSYQLVINRVRNFVRNVFYNINLRENPSLKLTSLLVDIIEVWESSLWFKMLPCFSGESKLRPHGVSDISSDKLTSDEGGELTRMGVLSSEVSSIMDRKGSGGVSWCLLLCIDVVEVDSEKLKSIRDDSEGVGDGVLGGWGEGECESAVMPCGTADNNAADERVSVWWWWLGDMAGDGMLICGGDFGVIVCCGGWWLTWLAATVIGCRVAVCGARTRVAVPPGRELIMYGLGVIIMLGFVVNVVETTLMVGTGWKGGGIGFNTCLPTNLLFMRLRFCRPRRFENLGKYCPICWWKTELIGAGLTAGPGAGANGFLNSPVADSCCSIGTANGPSWDCCFSALPSDISCFATPPPRPAAIWMPRLTGLLRDAVPPVGVVGDDAADTRTLGLDADKLLCRPRPTFNDWLEVNFNNFPRTPIQSGLISFVSTSWETAVTSFYFISYSLEYKLNVPVCLSVSS